LVNGSTADRLIPHTMSTQHPDNALIPDWCEAGDIIEGDSEISEAFFAYNDLGCTEVMWDSEGKDVDTYVVRKLLSRYGEYFKKNKIGQDLLLTYRIPNPRVELIERKFAVETLQNIPVSSDIASAFYGADVVPIFEVILPFTTTGLELIWLHNYYRKAIVSDEDLDLAGGVTVKDWVGEFKPKQIQVIPLIEDMESILSVDKILNYYIDAFNPSCMRVFIGRSDPALNYGMFSAILLSKLAFSKLEKLEHDREVAIHPILGVGSMPFRGRLSPSNIDGFLNEYKGLSTVTIQSAFRYDHPLEEVRAAVKILNDRLPNGASEIISANEATVLLSIIGKCRSKYQRIVEGISPLINSIAAYVPKRRARKLHIGLFGYSRNVGGIILPRAIPFAAAFYSLGIPPECIGASVLEDFNDSEYEVFMKYYKNIKSDFEFVGGYLSWQNVNMLLDMYQDFASRVPMNKENLKHSLTLIMADFKAIEEKLSIHLGSRTLSHRKHENLVSNFLISYYEKEDKDAKISLLEAASIRKGLG